ncbi:MAG TPA: LPS export ABC transporter periplasmic protein LptC [Flavihumibacter sp.]|nr:LPS export ABC transporter periplasmic protein LptC [Flavihumibacter sp.]HPZ86792.1 LPS export ABC transporter periplasmic protein LptC [Flavihumibacter sp.]HQD08320.1 LPS export ABC transporter periplasmic protein LptC [Flavihumibacter sp.]
MTNWYRYTLFAAMLFCGCENSMEDIKKLTEKRDAVEEALKVESYLSQGGQMKAKLTAPVMNRHVTDSPYIEFPQSLHVDFFDDSTKVENQLFARFGRYRENEGKVLLRDSVVVFNIRRDTMRTNELWWDQNKGIFYTDKPVDIHQPDKIVHSEGGLEADQSFNWYVLRQNVGTMAVPKGGFKVAPPDSTKRDSLRIARDSAARRGGEPVPVAPTPASAKPGAVPSGKPAINKGDSLRRRGFLQPTLIPIRPKPNHPKGKTSGAVI